MFTRHVTERLPRYCDKDLSRAEARAIERHLASCARCRGELNELRFASRLIRQLAPVSAPPSVWKAIDGALATAPVERPAPVLRWAFASLVLLVSVSAAAYWWTENPRPWEVTTLTERSVTRMAAGEWVETGPNARARITVGGIGLVDVEPGTRVRLGESRPTEYRLSLARGTIRAQIDAPPRLFIVETPASTVVDLGCAYSMTVAEDGTGLLRMTEGWTALEWNGRESLVPAGAVCRTRPRSGPGTPYFEDAPEALQRAVDAFDDDVGDSAAVDVIVREARVRDTLTLWHLLMRVDPGQRGRVYDRMAELVPPPSTVSRDKALQLDAEALRLLREELAWQW